MSIGTKYTTYFDEIASWSGYNANERIGDEDYQPSPKANKGFYLDFVEKNTKDILTGNVEDTEIIFELKILYRFDKSNDYSEFQAATWDLISAAEKALYAKAGTEGDVLLTDSITLRRKGATDYFLCVIPGFLSWHRSLS